MRHNIKRVASIITLCLVLIAHTSCAGQSSPLLQTSSIRDFMGVWKGAGYQHNTDSSWTITVFFDEGIGQYVIQYPSLGCTGYWQLINANDKTIEFREILTQGQGKCTDDGRVILLKTDSDAYEFYYYWPNDNNELTAFGLIKKQLTSR